MKAVTWNYDGGLTEMYASEQCQVDEEWMMRKLKREIVARTELLAARLGIESLPSSTRGS